MPFSLDETLVDALLDRLGHDDAFRELFQRDPRQALASLGHPGAASDAEDGVWMCMKVESLASKEAFVTSRAALRRQLLTETASQNPVNLQA